VKHCLVFESQSVWSGKSKNKHGLPTNQNILLQQILNLMTRNNMNSSFTADQNQDLVFDNVEDDQDLVLVDNQETANMHELNNIHQLNCSANAIQKLQKITSSCAKNLLLNVLLI
jgi:hypothetical protein